MRAPADLDVVLPGLPVIRVDRTYPRRVRLASLLGIAAMPAGTASFTIRPPEFLFVSGNASRFNPPGVRTLYVGEEESTATAEAKQEPGLEGFDVRPAAPHSLYHVEIKLSSVLDLTDPGVMAALETSEAELVAPWRLASPVAPTQLLGHAVFRSGRFEAIRYRSARNAAGHCLAVFRERKLPKSVVKVFDDGATWSEQW